MEIGGKLYPSGVHRISALFNVFINDKGIKCTLSKFLQYTKLCGEVDIPERRGIPKT